MRIDEAVLDKTPRIEELIQLMLKEAEEFGANHRKNYREIIVCPINVVLSDGRGSHNAFSKNLSASGACIICDIEVEPEEIATLEINRDNENRSIVQASCIWSRDFHGFFMSGWRFQKGNRNTFVNGSSD